MQIVESESDTVAPFPVRKFSKLEYQLLGKLGVLSVDDRVELLEGWMELRPFRFKSEIFYRS